MSIKLRLVLAFLLVAGCGFYYVFDAILNDIRPRYFEALEESMNDSVNIIAAYLEQDADDEGINLENVNRLSSLVYGRRFDATIYAQHKTAVDLQFYICDETGRVIFDSDDGKRVGRDFSQWNDVYLALQGKYGARSSRVNADSEGLLYVSAPVKRQGKIIGTVSVEKPKQSIAGFILLARKKTIALGLVSFAVFIVISVLLSFWITLPIKQLRGFVDKLRANRHADAPRFTGSEINALAASFETVFRELDGKKYVESYVHTLAHELKSPLTSIRSAAELLTEDLSNEQKDRFVANILRESVRVQTLIEKMLYLSSLENRGELTQTEMINAAEIIADVAASLGPQAEQRAVRFAIGCESGLVFEGEYFLVRHALLNLADNAIRYAPADSAVELACSPDVDSLVFSVRDYGGGIPDYALERLFEKFYSLARTGEGTRGSGLGLAFVKECASLHKGKVTIENIPEGGVLATLRIPRKHT